jgi:hypothetical protein
LECQWSHGGNKGPCYISFPLKGSGSTGEQPECRNAKTAVEQGVASRQGQRDFQDADTAGVRLSGHDTE